MANKWYVNEEKAWFKTWWPKDMAKNIEFEGITMREFFERQRKKYPNNNLFWFLDSWLTYDEVGQLIDKVATSFHNLGLRKGDVLGLLMPNCPQYFICYYACQKLGVIIAGLNPTYKSLEILHQIQTCNVKALVSLEPLYNMLIKPIIDKTNIEFIITTGIADLVKGNLSFEDFLTQKTSN
ncbi:MAG: AMP-binding protein, partial [Promethearchaeota archaeon]